MEEEQQQQQDQQLKQSDIDDRKQPKQQQKQMQPQQQQQQQQSTIISANGIEIKSNLNPDAKEFYPAYLMRQNPFQMQAEILKLNSPKIINLIDIGKLEVPGSKTSLDIVVNEIGANRTTETRQLLLVETIDEIKKNVCGDMIVAAECVGDTGDDVVGEKEEIGDYADMSNNDDNKLEMEINQISSEATIEPAQSAAALSTHLIKDNSSDSNSAIDINTRSTNGSENKSQLNTDGKRKSEKRNTIKKFSNMALTLSRRTNSSCKKTPTKTSSTSSNMSRTKRISESLHNLSTALKSKTDIKKSSTADDVSKVIPRSTTNIPKAPVGSGTLLSKNTAQQPSNGTGKESRSMGTAAATAENAVSLKSTSSNEKIYAPRTSAHGGSSKTLNSKSSATSTKTLDRPSSTTATATAKTKDSVGKLPRSTVASSLRHTEAQKVS